MQPRKYSNRIPCDDGRPLTAKDQYRIEVAELSPLTVSQELNLVEMARSGNRDAAFLLVESCLPYVLAVARKRAYMTNLDALDLIQAASERMVKYLEKAIWSRYPSAYLKLVARHAISCYCIEYGPPIRVPRTSYGRGKRAPVVISLDAPRGAGALLDLVEVQG